LDFRYWTENPGNAMLFLAWKLGPGETGIGKGHFPKAVVEPFPKPLCVGEFTPYFLPPGVVPKKPT